MKIAVIVPVSPFEPPELIEMSVRRIKSLDFSNYTVRILYVIDLSGKEDRRGRIPLSMGVEVLERNSTRGKRAGAINDGLSYFEDFEPDYIAIFDVDSIPEKNFIVECINHLENNPAAYIASTPRYISNPINLCSETVEVEYMLINFLLRKSSFKQFNGLIGVLRGEILLKNRLDENFLTEDAEFATRMHSLGHRAIFVRSSKIMEQAPLRWRDLFSQRRRWYFGGLQLWKHFGKVRKADMGFRVSWIMSLTLTYIVALFIPFLMLSPPLIYYRFRKIEKLKVTLGLLIHTIILQIAAFAAFYDYIRRRESKWHPQERVV
jgi:cellulose synthase/poly-beta-1,6-N-acetylglucosamine synthase-like glycosyltransferase